MSGVSSPVIFVKVVIIPNYRGIPIPLETLKIQKLEERLERRYRPQFRSLVFIHMNRYVTFPPQAYDDPPATGERAAESCPIRANLVRWVPIGAHNEPGKLETPYLPR